MHAAPSITEAHRPPRATRRAHALPLDPTERLVEYYTVRFLLAAGVLNLNGLSAQLFGVDQVFSLLMALASIVLIVRMGVAGISPLLLNLIIVLASFLAFGSVFSATISESMRFIQTATYAASAMMIWAVASYVASVTSRERLMQLLRYVRNIMLLSCLSVWFSQELYAIYKVAPLALDRNSGFFGNPNEAGIVAAIEFAILLALPYRSKIFQAVAVALVLGAVVLTFSKSSLIALIIVAALHAIRMRRFATIISSCVAVAFLLVFADDIASQQTVELTPSQRVRLQQVVKIFSGQIDADTTTGRSELWAYGLSRAIENFPFGDGLGSFHFLQGQKLENDVWQGVHNTFLMFLGESGPLPMVLLVFFTLYLVSAGIRHGFTGIEIGYIAILLLDMMATHHALSLRFHNALLGLVIGTLSISMRESRVSELQARVGSLQAGHGTEPPLIAARTGRQGSNDEP